MFGGLSPARFLGDYWQKKPLLVRAAFPDWKDPVAPDELAGLACEEGVESRIVRGKGKRWDVSWGPHPESRFAELPDRDWTLLVQELNRWVPESALLLDHFSFIPNVRVDDVMVSYAERGGSVGPHLDSYDVFLVQGQGERRWQWGSKPAKDRTFVPNLALRILANPVFDHDEVLGPGDMLYLPPGFTHHGVALSPCLTFSVGFRAPSAAEAWTSFANLAARTRPDAAALLPDPPLKPAEEPGAIPPALLKEARAFVRAMDLSDDAIDRWFARHTTRLKPGHAIEAPARAPNVRQKLAAGWAVARSEEGRWAYLPAPRGALRLYVGGEEIDVAKDAVDLAKLLCRARRHSAETITKASKTTAAKALLELLFAKGALAFVRAERS